MPDKKTNNSFQNGLVMLRQEKTEEGNKSPEEMKKVVMLGAKLMCPFHALPGTLLVTSNQVRLQGKMWATKADNSKQNFLFTALCTHPSAASSPTPCLSIITPMVWTDTGTIKIQDNKTLIKKSKIKCAISGQDITILHDGQTVTPNVMTNLSQDVVSNGNSRQICSDEVKSQLGRKAHEICDKGGKECKGSDACLELIRKISQRTECVNARKEVGYRCFDPPFNKGHADQINQEIDGIENCRRLHRKNKCKEPIEEPVPERVPVPVPAPQEDKDFMKRMEELTGLAGVALIIYLIISEGSRLFPPRNLIPVP